MSVKKKAALTSFIVPLLLTIIKVVIGLVTASMAVFASALDSFTDTCSAAITMVAVRTSEKPADDSHQFGHGKAESIAGLVQALLITISAGFLIYEAIKKSIKGYVLEDEVAGVAVMALALVVSLFLSRYLLRVSKETESTAIRAGALNISADVWTNAGVILALGLERWASIKNADPIISILISLYIITCAIKIARDAISQLMDKTLPREMLVIIDQCIHDRGPKVYGYHRLRTRSVGREKDIEFHLDLDKNLSFKDAHNITEAIIADIEQKIPHSNVTVHSDPR